jgi:lysostaphin
MRLLIDFSVDTRKTDRVQMKPISPNWKYGFSTLVLCMAIALPQLSGWVESQLPIRLFQRLAKTTNNVTESESTAFPTIKGSPMTSGFGWRIHPLTGERKFHSGIDFGASKGSPIYAFEAGLVEFAGSKGGYGVRLVAD